MYHLEYFVSYSKMESKMSDFDLETGETEGIRQNSMLEILETKLRSENQVFK